MTSDTALPGPHHAQVAIPSAQSEQGVCVKGLGFWDSHPKPSSSPRQPSGPQTFQESQHQPLCEAVNTLNNQHYSSVPYIFTRPCRRKINPLVWTAVAPCHTGWCAQALCALVRLSGGCANPSLRLQETQAEVVLAEEGQRVPTYMPAQRKHRKVTWRETGGQSVGERPGSPDRSE